MKLRYEKRGEVFIPQYFDKKTELWTDILKENVGENTLLTRICIALGNIGYPHRFTNGTWYNNVKNSPQYLMFANATLVNAFLGALKEWFTNHPFEEFEL